MRVLVVEDERRLAENVARSLRESAGYAVDVATEGEDGLFMAEANPCDLILLDLMLPGLDGLSLLRRFRNGGHSAPVLILTAREEKDSVVSLLNNGADDYVTKPSQTSYYRNFLAAAFGSRPNSCGGTSHTAPASQGI